MILAGYEGDYPLLSVYIMTSMHGAQYLFNDVRVIHARTQLIYMHY